MDYFLTSLCAISILLGCCTNNILASTNSTDPIKEELIERNPDEQKTSGADMGVPGVVRNLILMTSHHETHDGNKNHPEILPQDYIDEADEPRAVYTRKDRFYYCGPRNRNHCRSLCYAMGYPTQTCGRISCYCTF